MDDKWDLWCIKYLKVAEHGTKWFWIVFIATLGEYTVLKSLLYYSQENKSVKWVTIRFKHIFNVEALIVLTTYGPVQLYIFILLWRTIRKSVLLGFNELWWLFLQCKGFWTNELNSRENKCLSQYQKRYPMPAKSCFTQNGNVTLSYNMVYSLNKALCIKRSKINCFIKKHQLMYLC